MGWVAACSSDAWPLSSVSLDTGATCVFDTSDASVASGAEAALSVWLSGDAGGASALGVGGAAALLGADLAEAASAAAVGVTGEGLVVVGADSLAALCSVAVAPEALPRIRDATDGAVASRDTEVRSV